MSKIHVYNLGCIVFPDASPVLVIVDNLIFQLCHGDLLIDMA
ncbi:hypothetical protein AB4Z50_28240 [Paenibacillus sp. 2TAB26]